MKTMFSCERCIPCVELGVSFLFTRTSESLEQDCSKLLKSSSFIVTTRDYVLCLEVDGRNTLFWCVDVAFSVHVDIRSYANSVFTLGKGPITSGSSIQKRNARRSAQSETNSVDDDISKLAWIKFVDHQGWSAK